MFIAIIKWNGVFDRQINYVELSTCIDVRVVQKPNDFQIPLKQLKSVEKAEISMANTYILAAFRKALKQLMHIIPTH